MKLKEFKKITFLVFIIFFTIELSAQSLADSLTTINPAPKHWKETYMINSLLKQNHYRKLELNDSLSSVIFNDYFESLDYNKTYFLQADIDYFKKYEFELDDFILKGDVDVAFQIFRIFRERANARIDYVENLISQGFDYSKDESLNLKDENIEWAKSVDEVNDRWRLIIKSQALSYKLADKPDSVIVESLNKRYKRYRKGINQYNSDDVFQFFMNAYNGAYDPHTNYFSPISSENFNITMSQSLEGIGAQLSQSMDYTVINEVIPGGPAYTSKELQKDDKIIAVAQGNEGVFVDVIGWRLQDVVQLIRGKKGTIVRLQILNFDNASTGIPKEVRLVRDKITLEEQTAKSEIIPIYKGKQSYKMGVITLPSFYINFEDARNGVKDYTSTTRDVAKLLAEFKQEKVDGVLIDLRYNGGGSLKEAIDMTGLFIEDGPVVQVRNSDGSIEVQRDADKRVQYDGPLAVLINRYSASASEIFSGAIQDYNRGIIIGESSFGKGTVQNLIDLNRMFPKDADRMGQLKLTLAKFYRVDGRSTQNVGVTPDIEFPTAFEPSESGESSRPNALPWDQISSAYYRPTNDISQRMIDNLNELYQEHLKKDQALIYLKEDIDRIKGEKNSTLLSLNINERKLEMKEDEDRNDRRKTTLESSGSLSKELTDSEEDQKKLDDDPYLKEGLTLLSEITR